MFTSPRAYLTKVFIQIFLRNRQYIIFSLLLPIVILGIVGLNDGEVDPIDIGLVDKSSSDLSASFSNKLSSNNLFNVIEGNEEALKEKLINGDIMMILVIPNTMNSSNKTNTIKLLVDKSQIQFIQTIQPVLNQTLLSIEREITQEQAMFDLSIEDVKSRSQGYLDFLLPGIMAFMLMNLSIAGSGFNLVEYRRRGILKRLFVTPIRPKDFIISIVLARMIIVLFQLTVVLSIALLLLDIKITGSYFSFYSVVVLGTFIFLSLGFALGSIAKTQEGIRPIVGLVTFPQVILSGVFFPISTMPEIIQPIVYSLPLSSIVSALREIANDGSSFFSLTNSTIGILIWVMVAFLISTRFFVWKEVAR